MLAERLPRPRYIPTTVAEGISNLTGIFPESIRKPMIRMADQLPFAPDAAVEIAKRQTWGYFHEILKGALQSSEQLPSKEYQWLAARAELFGQSRIDMMMFYKSFPDRPRRKNKILQPNMSFFDRRMNALLFSRHPSNGLPDEWFLKDAEGKYLQRELGLDGKLLHEMYYQLPEQERQQAYFEMEDIFDQTVKEDIPKVEPDILNRLRFLGLSTEEEYIRTAEENLFKRINTKITQIVGTESDRTFSMKRLSEFMDLARQSDLIRSKEDPQNKGRRRTGESYYCHYLASAWLLWTMLEEDIITPQDLADALEDTETMMVHDIMEDLPYKIRTIYDSVRGENRFFLDMNIPQVENTPERIVSVELTRNQWLILEAMYKPQDDESGFIWLEKIKNIYDANDPTPQRKNYLMKKAARCKAADRLANLLTITSAGGSYFDVVRKLNETIYAGRYLLWLSHFADLGPVGTIDKLRKMSKNNKFVLFLSSIPLIAEMEKRNLMVKFGQRMMEKIREKQDRPWAKQLVEVIDREVRFVHGRQEPLPYGWRRFEDLIACYRIMPEFFDYIIPSERLYHYLSLEEFVTQENFFPPNQPIEFGHFRHLVSRLEAFEQWMIPWEGVLPGGLDDHYGPRPLIYIDVFNILDLSDKFMEEMAETIAWGKAFEYEDEE
jgi:hypothetical protein